MKKEKTWSDSNLIIDTELLGGSASENKEIGAKIKAEIKKKIKSKLNKRELNEE